MKKFTTLLIGGSIVLAGAAWAQQPEASSTPEKKKNKQAEQTTPAPRQPRGNAGEGRENAGQQNAKERGAGKGQQARKNQSANEEQTGPNATPAMNQSGEGKKGRREHEASNSATPAATASEASAKPEQGQPGRKGMKNRAANAKAVASPAAPAAAAATPAAMASAAAARTSVSGQQNAQLNANGKPKKVEQQQVEQIKTQHVNFKAQARPQQVQAVTFNQNYRIQEAQSWTGPQYEVFRTYHPERHDAGFYRSHYNRVELIGGGYYYFNNGYWYPAWGYNPSAEYYAYDGPIYAGHQAKPWDQVIADVQTELQQMGYYRGEVDGLLGPFTREALTAYQNEQGLTATAVIDEPTLDSLGLS
jgi:Putative peptidoglycan binding domain